MDLPVYVKLRPSWHESSQNPIRKTNFRTGVLSGEGVGILVCGGVGSLYRGRMTHLGEGEDLVFCESLLLSHDVSRYATSHFKG